MVEGRLNASPSRVVGPGTARFIGGPGTFISAPPNVCHADANRTQAPVRVLGTLAPAGDGGLETCFRQMGVAVEGDDGIPDLTRPVEHLRAEIARRRAAARPNLT